MAPSACPQGVPVSPSGMCLLARDEWEQFPAVITGRLKFLTQILSRFFHAPFPRQEIQAQLAPEGPTNC